MGSTKIGYIKIDRIKKSSPNTYIGKIDELYSIELQNLGRITSHIIEALVSIHTLQHIIQNKLRISNNCTQTQVQSNFN